jgi:hypothetical protein
VVSAELLIMIWCDCVGDAHYNLSCQWTAAVSAELLIVIWCWWTAVYSRRCDCYFVCLAVETPVCDLIGILLSVDGVLRGDVIVILFVWRRRRPFVI